MNRTDGAVVLKTPPQAVVSEAESKDPPESHA